MKNIITFLVLLCGSISTFAQGYNSPMASPRQTLSQQFSITHININYSRPGVKGRKIFGELVPFGKIWRAGANEATNITFGQDVVFGGKPTKAGSYAIFITPFENQWNIVLNYDADAWGAFSYDPNENAIEVKATVEKLPYLQEWLEYSFEDMDKNTVTLVIKWEYSVVKIPIKVDKEESVDKIIEYLNEIKQVQREMAN